MEMTEKQRAYIKAICEYYEMPFPNIKTKKEAQEWLKKMIPIYEIDTLAGAFEIDGNSMV